MPELTNEQYWSRTAEIKAKRAEALAAYESAALESAMNPAAGGQAEARAVLDDLAAQQDALEDANPMFAYPPGLRQRMLLNARPNEVVEAAYAAAREAEIAALEADYRAACLRAHIIASVEGAPDHA